MLATTNTQPSWSEATYAEIADLEAVGGPF